MQREITRELVRRLPARAHGGEQQRGSYGSVLAAAGSMAYRGRRRSAPRALCAAGPGWCIWPASSLLSSWYFPARRNAAPAAAARQPTGHPPAGRRRAAPLVRGQARRFAGRARVGESAADVCKALLGRNAPWAGAVLDADALNALAAGKYRGDLPANTILTPHPGEAARLLGLTVPEVQADREGAAVSLAEKYHCVAVLKGHHTLVAAPDGTVWRNETGNAGLAKGRQRGYFSRSDRRASGSGSKAGPQARGRRGLRGMAPRRRCRPLRQAPQHDRHAAGDLFEDLGWILGSWGDKAADRKAAGGGRLQRVRAPPFCGNGV